MTKGEKLPFAFSLLQAEGQGPKEEMVQKFLEPSRAKQSGQLNFHIYFIRSQPFSILVYSRYYFNPTASPTGSSQCFPGLWGCWEDVMECSLD